MTDMRDIERAINNLTDAVRAQNKLIEAMGQMFAQFMNYQVQKDQKEEKEETPE
jgi:hypothetical protein